MRFRSLSIALLLICVAAIGDSAQEAPAPPSDPRLEALKSEAIGDIERGAKLGQEIIDSLFSFGELGFQEVESSRCLKDVLRRNGFVVQDGIAGIPTAWTATGGSGKPVIALGSDIDACDR